MFTGTYTAIVTPFKNGKIDEAAFARLIKIQIKAGVDGVVPVGTTGTGANATAEAIHLTCEAEKLGADGSLQVAPYYNKPTQEGLFQHFREIARNTKLPLVLYSIPGRCGIENGVDTVKRLAESCKNIIGIKEAGGSCDRISQLRAALGSRFEILSGDDSLTVPFMSVGAEGVISVASNVIPREIAQMVRAFASGDAKKALQLHQKYYPIFKDLFIETNPVPVKAALAMMGQIEEEYRLPLAPMSAKNREVLKATLK